MTLTILFLHHNFPGQFTHLLHEFLKQDHKIYFISEACSKKPKPGINHILLGENDDTSSSINANFERTSKFRKAMINLRKQGVNPDIVVSHSGCDVHFMLRKFLAVQKSLNLLSGGTILTILIKFIGNSLLLIYRI